MSRFINTVIILITFWSYASSLECFKCRSDVEETCAVSPGPKLDVIECPKDINDKCAVKIVNKVTYRNCLSAIPGDDCNGPLCQTCETDLCNSEVFPKDRWACYQCSGTACLNVTQSKLKSSLCPKYVEKDRCFTNIIGIHHIVRGCVSGEEKLCPNICLKCDSVGCNNEQGVFESTCQSCQWMPGTSLYPKDFGCKRTQFYDNHLKTDICRVVRDDKTCVQKILLGHREKCFTHWNPHVNVVVRGCSSTMGAYPSGKLWECGGNNCNSGCINMKCNVCDADENSNCRNNTRMIHAVNCSDNTFSCFSCEDSNQKLQRGCDFQKSSVDKQCYTCYDEDGCNKEIVRTCYKCVSTDNLNCAKWNDISTIAKEKCGKPNEKCVVTKTMQYTVRGCETKVRECTDGDPNCRRCETSLCNSGSFE